MFDCLREGFAFAGHRGGSKLGPGTLYKWCGGSVVNIEQRSPSRCPDLAPCVAFRSTRRTASGACLADYWALCYNCARVAPVAQLDRVPGYGRSILSMTAYSHGAFRGSLYHRLEIVSL